MDDIGRLVKRIMSDAPDDLLGPEAVASLWEQAVAGTPLARIRPLGYCRGRLYVSVPGSVFAARLREETPHVLDALRAHAALAGLREIVVRPASPSVPAPLRAAPLRPPSATACVAALSEIIGDEALRASLARLAASMRDGGDSSDPVL